MGGLTAYAHSHILNNLREVKEGIQMLFLARSVLEQVKAYGELRAQRSLCSGFKGYRIVIDTKKSAIAGYKEVTVTIVRCKGAVVTLTTGIFHEVA